MTESTRKYPGETAPGRVGSVRGIARVAGFAIAASFWAFSGSLAQTRQDPPAKTQTSSGYVGSQACAECHAQISREYAQTDMGRSMAVVSASGLPDVPATFSNETLHRKFDIRAESGQVYQSESELNADGTERFRAEF